MHVLCFLLVTHFLIMLIHFRLQLTILLIPFLEAEKTTITLLLLNHLKIIPLKLL
jgi:hypothetical protein